MVSSFSWWTVAIPFDARKRNSARRAAYAQTCVYVACNFPQVGDESAPSRASIRFVWATRKGLPTLPPGSRQAWTTRGVPRTPSG